MNYNTTRNQAQSVLSHATITRESRSEGGIALQYAMNQPFTFISNLELSYSIIKWKTSIRLLNLKL